MQMYSTYLWVSSFEVQTLHNTSSYGFAWQVLKSCRESALTDSVTTHASINLILPLLLVQSSLLCSPPPLAEALRHDQLFLIIFWSNTEAAMKGYGYYFGNEQVSRCVPQEQSSSSVTVRFHEMLAFGSPRRVSQPNIHSHDSHTL